MVTSDAKTIDLTTTLDYRPDCGETIKRLTHLSGKTRQPAFTVDTADRPPHLLCIMSTPHPRIVYALPPKRRRLVKARHIRQEVPAIVGPEPQSLEPDAETLTRADKADALFRELVRQAKGG
jgi:hypothetical protein